MDSDTKGQFDQVNSRLDEFTARFDRIENFMLEHVVTKDYLEERLEHLPTKADFHNLVTAVDGYAKQVKDTDEEIKVLGHKADRLESWVKKAATKIGVDYNV